MTAPKNFDEKNEPSLLLDSYNSIVNKACLEITIDQPEKEFVSNAIQEILGHDSTTEVFSIQNLFKLKKNNGCFYVAQCLSDAGLSYGGGKYDRSLRNRYQYYTIGFGKITVDLGDSLLREKTLADKLVDHFTHSTIQIENGEKFNKEFYLISTNKENITKYFDANFINAIGKYSGFTLITKSKEMYLTFENQLEPAQASIIEDIFSAFKFWTDYLPDVT